MEGWIKLRGKKIMSSDIDVKPMLFENGKRRKVKIIYFKLYFKFSN